MSKEIIKSPCTEKCRYNEDKICESCFRTQSEIVFWTDFTNEQKKEILKRIEKKKKK